MVIKSYHLLDKNQYYHTKQCKDRIVLHHTAGGSVHGSISWWNRYKDHICTPYIIDRIGNIYELFDPSYWAFALGVNSIDAEKRSIQIEICNRGWLKEINGELYYSVGSRNYKFKGDHIKYEYDYRGHKYYEKYTKGQIDSVLYLIDYLVDKFNLDIYNIKNFWLYDPTSSKSLISHTTLRKDKSDIHPQPNLIGQLYKRYNS